MFDDGSDDVFEGEGGGARRRTMIRLFRTLGDDGDIGGESDRRNGSDSALNVAAASSAVVDGLPLSGGGRVFETWTSLDAADRGGTWNDDGSSSSAATADANETAATVFDETQLLQKYLGPMHRSQTESVILTIVYVLIFLSGVVGNVCTGIVVISKTCMRTSTNYYLCSLAISDVLTLILGKCERARRLQRGRFR